MGIIQIEGHSIHPAFLGGTSLVFDLGANHGAFSRRIVDRFHCRCVAVEANASLASAIARMADIEVIHAAIGDSERIVEFAIAGNDQCSSIFEQAVSGIERMENVKMFSLEALLNRFATPTVDLVKMDIEGAEIMALDACPDATLGRIAQLALEFHESQGLTRRDDIDRISVRLHSLGFAWIRGTFSNFEDNLYINTKMCPMTSLEIWGNRTAFRILNGLKRVIRRKRLQLRSA